MPKTLIPYMRQSRRKERTISIEEQRRAIEQWAASHKVKLAPEVVEQGVSGSKPWRERALGEVVDSCARGEASGVIVAWQDRLSRENGLATAEVWEALEQAGARLVCAGEGVDTASGDHELTFTIKAAIARDQWKRHRANWEQARRNAIERGVFPGRPPFGYRGGSGKPLQVVKGEARRVEAAFRARADGEAMTSIARRFGWSHSTCRQMLACETYLGVAAHGGFRNEGAHEAIVDRDLFDAVQASRTTQPVALGETTRDRLLVGIARCGGCGKTLRVVRRKRADGSYAVAYYCKNASTKDCSERAYVHADELDEHVRVWFEEALASERRVVDVVEATRDLREAQTALERLQRDRDAYLGLVIDDAAAFQRGLDVRQERIGAAEEQVRQLSAQRARIPAGGSLAELWAGFDALERRQVLAGFLDRVVVRHGASANLVESVDVVWADGSVAGDEDAVGMLAA
jgi:DNA invertase Pin-like site-specific DNA recombinase